MKRIKKRIRKTLHYGKLQSLDNQLGNLNGVKEDLDGTYSVQLWQELSLARSLIFIQAV
jgi:hypothetical protein